jgi:hypothetical protein
MAMRRRIIGNSTQVPSRQFTGEPLEPRRLFSGFGLHVLTTFQPPGNSSGEIVADNNGDLFFLHGSGNLSGPGAIWELPKGSSTATQVALFNSTLDGSERGIAIDSSGDLFGTGLGSASSDGNIWELASGSNSIITLASFSRQLNGSDPSASHLVLDSSGDLFGLTLLGGADQEGIVWELPHGSSTITVLAPIPPAVNPGSGQVTVDGLAIDSHGNLYGTVSPNGNTGNGSVWELPAGSNTIQIVASFDGTDGSGPVSPLIVDSSGDIFGASSAGGASFGNANALSGQGFGSIFEIAAGTSTITTLASFTGTDGEAPNSGLVTDSSGNLFGVAMTGTNTDSLLFELSKGANATTTLQTFNSSTGVQAGTAPFVDSNGDVIDATDIALFELSPGSGGGGGGGAAALTPTTSGKLPALVITGQKTAVSQTVTLTNTGGTAYSGPATAQLFLDTGTSIDANAIALPAKVTKTLRLTPHAHVTLRLALASLPASTPDGTYHLLAKATDKSGNTAAAASVGTITVAAPEVKLSVTLSKFATTAKGGKKFTETLSIANSGNVPASGTVPIEVFASPDGLQSDATQLPTPPKKLNVKNGKSETVSLSLTAPASGISDFLIFVVDPNDKLKEVTPANDTLVTPSAVRFV